MEDRTDAPAPSATQAPEGLDGRRSALRAALEVRRRAVFARIAGYPPPIAGCDQQFNHLLVRREALTAALNDLDAALDGHPDDAALEAVLEAVLARLEPDDREALPFPRPK